MASSVLLPPLHPAVLPLHTVVGTWRVVAWAGNGVFGAVYRAVPAHDEHASPVVLKLAMHPADPRFAREGVLLSRCHHPSIPRLLDRGSWQSPAGTLHPFLVMQWVDGVSLYEQARLQPADPPQLRLWLLQLAQALAVLYEQGAVHHEDGTLHQEGVRLPGALVRHRHVDPALRALTLRLLSVQPELRGTAGQLALELESTLRPFRPSNSGDAANSIRPRARPRHGWHTWALAASGLALAIGAWRALPGKSWQEHERSVARAEPAEADSADAGTSGLGDAATSMAVEKAPAVCPEEGLGEDPLPEPVPGQVGSHGGA